MIKGRREGLQILKDGSVKLTISISKEDLPEAVNINDLFIVADMPNREEQAILPMAIGVEGYDRIAIGNIANTSFKNII